MNVPQVVKIKDIIEETPTVKTLIFDWEVTDEVPGQFMMLWNFHDEKPMSLSLIDPVKGEIGFTIRKVGKFTQALHDMEVGNQIGLRGPYGRGFEISGSHILAVGGGVGMAPLAAFAEEASRKDVAVDLISAAATEKELLFMNRLNKTKINIWACTDDGTCGFCGFGTELAQKVLENVSYDMIVTCGPEIMMKKIADLADYHKIPAQFSLERYMKCGVGICGQCCVDNVGWRICKEGPVFWDDEVKLITEFGKYHRDAAGRKELF
ncbi:MAG: dihydroorotate dehydrogenase electron transfer subunit [Methanobacterium sp.]|jgi:dihydroorotate dehydrogenase electron transfer subunit|nr:MAG: dihydroorotate dehydrogenase electron transfer subunit [Methanobacterium sp.]